MTSDLTPITEEIKLDTGQSTQRLPPQEAARRAQKRAAIGLAPSRPTARATVQRPPRRGFSALQQWLLILLIGALLLTTTLLVLAKMVDSPTAWPEVAAQWRAWFNPQASPSLGTYRPGEAYQLRVADDFTTPTGLVAEAQAAGAWSTAVVPSEGRYHMQIWPGHLTWSTIAIDPTAPYRVDASVTIVDLMPEGYSGFIARYQDSQNFYLFMVDGLGRYQSQRWQGGALQTLQPWTLNAAINRAGMENVLSIEDDGTQLRLLANGILLDTVATPQLPPGSVGLLGGAAERTMAEINVDWLRVYDFVQQGDSD